MFMEFQDKEHQEEITENKHIRLREPGSAITHFIAFLLTAMFAYPLLIKAHRTDAVAFYSMAVFIGSMLMLYAASTVFHSVNAEGRKLRVFRKIDHMMVFVLIAGTYTPVALLVLPPETGRPFLSAVWTIAICGMLFKLLWVGSPKWLTATIYILFGWFALGVYDMLITLLSRRAFYWLLAGGIIYTVGGVLYSFRSESFDTKHPVFDAHAVFHLFIMAGSICHAVFMFKYVL